MIPKFRVWLKNDKEMIDGEEIHWDRGELDFIGDAITRRSVKWICRIQRGSGNVDE